MKYNMYKSIDTLPKWNFEKIRETNDFRYLLRADEYDVECPDIKLFTNIWDIINDQYIDATKHRFENRQIADLHRQVLQLTIKYNAVRGYSFILMIDIENEKALQGMANLGFKIKTLDDVKSAITRSKNFKTQIREKKSELTKLQSDGSGMTIEELVDVISDHKKRSLDIKKITVKEWIAIEDNFTKSLQRHAANRQKESIR